MSRLSASDTTKLTYTNCRQSQTQHPLLIAFMRKRLSLCVCDRENFHNQTFQI